MNKTFESSVWQWHFIRIYLCICVLLHTHTQWLLYFDDGNTRRNGSYNALVAREVILKLKCKQKLYVASHTEKECLCVCVKSASFSDRLIHIYEQLAKIISTFSYIIYICMVYLCCCFFSNFFCLCIESCPRSRNYAQAKKATTAERSVSTYFLCVASLKNMKAVI